MPETELEETAELAGTLDGKATGVFKTKELPMCAKVNLKCPFGGVMYESLHMSLD